MCPRGRSRSRRRLSSPGAIGWSITIGCIEFGCIYGIGHDHDEKYRFNFTSSFPPGLFPLFLPTSLS